MTEDQRTMMNYYYQRLTLLTAEARTHMAREGLHEAGMLFDFLHRANNATIGKLLYPSHVFVAAEQLAPAIEAYKTYCSQAREEHTESVRREEDELEQLGFFEVAQPKEN